jgi:hypothetical protein
LVLANQELIKILQRHKNLPLQQHTPPNQTTIPTNSKFSRESTDSINSRSSSNSNAEHFTHLFAYQFINAFLLVVQKYFGKISWLDEKYNTMMHRFSPPHLILLPQLIFRMHQHVKIKLDIEIIHAIDDDGIFLSNPQVHSYDIHTILIR